MSGISQLRRSSAIEQILTEGWLTKIDWISEIDSTNSFLKRQLIENQLGPLLTLPQLVVADQQTMGRGRGQNAWWSPKGCLMFSLAWKPEASPSTDESDIRSRLTQLPLLVGVSIASALRSFLMNPEAIKVKWPNDIYVDNKKLGGILIESVLGTTEPFWIIGVGLNVLVEFVNAPEPIRSKATSLHLECSRSAREGLCRETILIAITQHLRQSIECWSAQTDYLKRLWPDYCMLTDRWVDIHQTHRCLQGICRGIDERGTLLIEDSLGQTHTAVNGEVRAWV